MILYSIIQITSIIVLGMNEEAAPGFLGNLSHYPSGIYGSVYQINQYAKESMTNLLMNDDDLGDFLNLEQSQSHLDIFENRETPVTSSFSSEPLHSRFAAPLTDSMVTDLNKSVIPKKTMQRDNWAFNALKDWQVQRDVLPDELYKEAMEKQLQLWTESELNYWIPKFLYEVRKKNGLRYPASSLISLVSGLQHKINQLDSNRCENFFEKNVSRP